MKPENSFADGFRWSLERHLIIVLTVDRETRLVGLSNDFESNTSTIIPLKLESTDWSTNMSINFASN